MTCLRVGGRVSVEGMGTPSRGSQTNGEMHLVALGPTVIVLELGGIFTGEKAATRKMSFNETVQIGMGRFHRTLQPCVEGRTKLQ